MNTPEYKKAYMANLNQQMALEKKYMAANKDQPSTRQYMQNTQQTILGINLNETKPKGTKKK